MTKRMLIDSSHPEETRVVILDGSKVEEFDFEAASKRPLKGNIYLAKVTRVEPSLQAAFVEYGGNRQGFLAFAEIHPDYYQIPVADRQALLAEQEAEARRRQEDDIESFEITGARSEDADETEEDGDEETGEEDAEMAPLVPLDAAPESEDAAGEEDGPESNQETDQEPDQEPDQDHDEVFVHLGGGPVEHEQAADGEHDHDEPAKPEAAQEALAIAAILHKGGLQRRLNARHLGEIDVSLERPLGRGLEIKFLDFGSVENDHPCLFRVAGVDKHAFGHGNLRRARGFGCRHDVRQADRGGANC